MKIWNKKGEESRERERERDRGVSKIWRIEVFQQKYMLRDP